MKALCTISPLVYDIDMTNQLISLNSKPDDKVCVFYSSYNFLNLVIMCFWSSYIVVYLTPQSVYLPPWGGCGSWATVVIL